MPNLNVSSSTIFGTWLKPNGRLCFQVNFRRQIFLLNFECAEKNVFQLFCNECIFAAHTIHTDTHTHTHILIRGVERVRGISEKGDLSSLARSCLSATERSFIIPETRRSALRGSTWRQEQCRKRSRRRVIHREEAR